MNSRVIIDFLARTNPLEKGVDKVVDSLQIVERTVKRVRQAMFVGGAAIGTGLVAAGVKAASFEREMRNVNSIVQAGEKQFQRTGNSVLEMATKVPRSANELARGSYEIVSAGFQQPVQMLSVLDASSRAASAGLTTVNTASLAIVTAMNSYGAAAGNAARVSDLLFKTVDVGQTTFEQLAENLGDFIGIANAAGATLPETLSAFASVTTATGQAAQSATMIRGIYSQLIKPSEDLEAALNNIGFSSAKQAIQVHGLQGTLELLSESVGHNETALAKLFPDVRGLNGVLALVGPNAGKARENLAAFTDESRIAGATQRALTEQSKSFGYQLDQLKSSTGALAIEFGQTLVPFMKLGITALNTLVDALHSVPAPVRNLVMGLGLMVAVMATVGITALSLYRAFRLVSAGLALIHANQALTYVSALASRIPVLNGVLMILQRTTGLSAASMIGFAKAAGVALAALVAVPMAVRGIQNMLTPQNIDEMTRSLLEAGETGTWAGTRLEEKFGKGLRGIARDIDTFTEENKGFWKSMNLQGTEPAVRRVDELDKAFAKLVQSGNINMARRLFFNMEKDLKDQGFSVKQIDQAFNDYKNSLAEIDLQNRATGDSQQALSGAVDDTSEAMKVAQEEAEAYKESIEALQEGTRTFLSVAGVLTKIEDKHRTAFDNAEKARQALERQRDRAKDVARAQDDMAKAQDKVNQITAQAPIPGTKGWYDLRDAQRDVAEQAEKLRGSQEKVNAEYKKTAPTIKEVIATFQDQINAFTSFQKNLQIIAGRGVPIEVVRELQSMGEEGVQLAAMLASAPPAEFDKLKGVLSEKVRLASEEVTKAMDLELVTAAAVARKGAQSTVEAILDEIKKLAPGIDAELPNVREALVRLGIAAGPPIPAELLAQAPSGTTTGQQHGPPIPTPPGAPRPRGTQSDIVGGSLRPSGGMILADNGATIRPGINVVENRTALPEYILTAAQMQALVPSRSTGGASTGGNVTHVTHKYEFGDIYAQDLTAAMRQADQKRRLGALAGG